MHARTHTVFRQFSRWTWLAGERQLDGCLLLDFVLHLFLDCTSSWVKLFIYSFTQSHWVFFKWFLDLVPSTSISSFGQSVSSSLLHSFLAAIISGGPRLAGTKMSPFWILSEPRMTEVVSGDNWCYKTCKAPVKSSPPKNEHSAFLQTRCPSCRPTNSVRALQEKVSSFGHFGVSSLLQHVQILI